MTAERGPKGPRFRLGSPLTDRRRGRTQIPPPGAGTGRRGGEDTAMAKSKDRQHKEPKKPKKEKPKATATAGQPRVGATPPKTGKS